MAYEVIYKNRFLNKLDRLLVYIEAEWGSKAALNFLDRLEEKIKLLKVQPETGMLTTHINVRSVLVTAKNKVYYRFENNRIEILNMIDTRRKPEKNPFNKKG